MSLVQNIPRWIMASARAYFDAAISPTTVIFYEHTGDKTLLDSNHQPITTYMEFRLDGPYSRQITKNETHYDIEINILCVATVDEGNADKIEMPLGLAHSVFLDGSFSVFRYGDNEQDDQSYIGCMVLQTGKNEEVRVSRFGQANADTKIIQASVEGHYSMKLFQRS